MADMIRVVRRRRATTVPNELVTDWRLSLKSKGLMLVLLSRPANWRFKVSGLAAFCHCGRDAIRTALEEMEAAGYLERKQGRAERGKFGGNEYIVYDVSRFDTDDPPATEPLAAEGVEEPPPLSGFPTTVESAPLPGFPATDDPLTGNPLTENPTPDPNKRDSSKDTPLSPPTGGTKRPRRQKGPPEPDWRPELFERFWLYYPRDYRGNKKKARAAWNKLRPEGDTLRALANALERHMRGERWKEGIGIPNASTYINPENGYWDMGDADRPVASTAAETATPGLLVESRFEKL